MKDSTQERDLEQRGLKDDMPIYSDEKSTLQTPAEHKQDQKVDPRKDDTISIPHSNVNNDGVTIGKQGQRDGEAHSR
jgi:hypothetical protein